MMLAALLLVTGTIWGQASKNMSLIGHLTFPDDLADVVGYKAGNTEYAFVGHESGVGIVSLANPANPVLLQDLPEITPSGAKLMSTKTTSTSSTKAAMACAL